MFIANQSRRLLMTTSVVLFALSGCGSSAPHVNAKTQGYEDGMNDSDSGEFDVADAASDANLADMRGGFITAGGLFINFNLTSITNITTDLNSKIQKSVQNTIALSTEGLQGITKSVSPQVITQLMTTGTDVTPASNTPTNSGTQIASDNIQTPTDTQVASNTKAGSGTQAGSGAGSNAGSGAGSNAGSGAGSGAGSNAGSGIQIASDTTQAGSGTGSGSQTGSGTLTGSGSQTGSASQTGSGVQTAANVPNNIPSAATTPNAIPSAATMPNNVLTIVQNASNNTLIQNQSVINITVSNLAAFRSQQLAFQQRFAIGGFAR